MHLVLSRGILNFDGLLDGTLMVFFCPQDLLLLVDDFAHGRGLSVEVLLAHLHKIQRLHELLHAGLATRLEVADDALGGSHSIAQTIRLICDTLDV